MAAILLGTSGSNWGNVQALLQQLSGDRAGPAGSGHDIHWLDYARMQCWAMTRYVRLCFWPSPLIFAYGRDMAQGFWGVAPSALWVAMMMGATAWGLWRRHWAGYGGAWFILILAPTSSVVPLSGQMVAEHRMYLPLAAVIMLVVTGGFFAWRHFTRNLGEESRRWACVAGACLMVMLPAVLGAVTMARNEDYKTALSLWQDSVTKWPRSAEAQNAMGFALHQKGRLAESIPCYQKALEIRPDYTLAHTNLGNALRDQGNVAEALSHFQRAVALKPENAETHANLGGALLQSGKLTEALEQYQKALDLNPHSAGEHCNLGSALIEMGRIDDGLFHLYKALEIDDKCLQAHHNLGNMLLRRGQVAEAIQHYRKVLEIMPGYVEGHNNLAMALFQNGQLRDALGQFEESLQINPQGLSALNNLARMLAIGGDPSLRDGRRALELALRANQISGDKNPFILQTLAAAYAENGRFTEADETAERAESFARAQGNHDELEKIHTIRSLYQAGKPWHLPAVAGGDGASH
jgi:tetratricopeptide (TPR) repeat protein